jgi:hypothetical protein
MLKTLKVVEKNLLFKIDEEQDTSLIFEYFKYLNANPASLILKIFGVYELSYTEKTKTETHQMKQYFIITENLVNN